MATVDGKTAVKRLEEKFQQLKGRGLLDLKVSTVGGKISSETSVEDLAEEVLAVIDLYERGDFEDITDKLD